MVEIGLVGIGFMGMIHFLASARLPPGTGRVSAICSRDPKKRLGDWTSIQGNFGPRGTHVDLSDVGCYAAYDDLLADPRISLVDLCVPNDQHAVLAVRALEAGKDVLVEKPIALALADADRMLDAARANGRILMVGHVLPFFPDFAFALDAVLSAQHGRLLAAHFTRVISRPDWSAAIGDAARTGGPAIDLHIHDTHFVGLLCGPPRAVRSQGVVEQGAVAHLTTQYLFHGQNPPAVSAVSGAICQKGRPFAHGFEIYLERATISLGIAHSEQLGQLNPLTVYADDGTVHHPALGSGDPVDAFQKEMLAAVQAVSSRMVPGALSPELARHALALCLAEVDSVRQGREQVVN